MAASSAVWTSSARIFLFSLFRQGAFLTSTRAKSDDAGAESDRSRNALAINVILKAATVRTHGVPPQITGATADREYIRGQKRVLPLQEHKPAGDGKRNISKKFALLTVRLMDHHFDVTVLPHAIAVHAEAGADN